MNRKFLSDISQVKSIWYRLNIIDFYNIIDFIDFFNIIDIFIWYIYRHQMVHIDCIYLMQMITSYVIFRDPKRSRSASEAPVNSFVKILILSISSENLKISKISENLRIRTDFPIYLNARFLWDESERDEVIKI